MNQEKKRPKEKKERKLISLQNLFYIVIGVWIISAVIIWFSFKNWNSSGVFGDTFGAINSLFSGLALAGIIYTIYLQKNELRLQRKELKYTRKQIKRTANAQEESASLISEQIRTQNIPYLQFHSTRVSEKECLVISNESQNPCFDIDIWVFATMGNSIIERGEYIKNYVKTEEVKFMKFTELDEDMDWCITERGCYHSFPINKKITIPIDYPKWDNDFEIFIQFRDNLGNNYTQLIWFKRTGWFDNPFIYTKYEPKVPTVNERVELTNKEYDIESIPDIAKELHQIKGGSIFASRIKNHRWHGVENAWKMTNV